MAQSQDGKLAFDTLEFARRLAAAGIPAQHADATAEALADAIGEAVVTRDDLDIRFAELRSDLTKWMIGLLLRQTAVSSTLVKLH